MTIDEKLTALTKFRDIVAVMPHEGDIGIHKNGMNLNAIWASDMDAEIAALVAASVNHPSMML